MASRRGKVLVGVFHDRGDAERALAELRQAGFKESQLGFISREKGRARAAKKKNDETLAEEGGVAGTLAGAGVGALVGLGVLSGVIPVIGPAIAGGTLGVLLSNAAAGAAVAGLAGALIGLGIPEEDAEWYEGELKSGRTIVTVKGTSRLDEARTIIQRHNGYDRESGAAGGTSTARATGRRGTTTEGRTLELHEEKLRAEKRPVKAGEVRVRKEVVSEHKTIDVPVEREEVFVERRPAGGRAASSASIREGEEIRIPVREEQVSVQKTPVVREEVRVGKRTVRGSKKVSGTVRKERARVEGEGDVHVTDTGSDTRVTPRKR